MDGSSGPPAKKPRIEVVAEIDVADVIAMPSTEVAGAADATDATDTNIVSVAITDAPDGCATDESADTDIALPSTSMSVPIVASPSKDVADGNAIKPSARKRTSSSPSADAPFVAASTSAANANNTVPIASTSATGVFASNQCAPTAPTAANNNDDIADAILYLSGAMVPIAKRPHKLKLIDLNEDCIVAILRYLPLVDLNAMGLTCHHFNRLATTVYAYHNRFKEFDIAKMAGRYESDLKLDVGVDSIKQYLKKFGHLIDHIDFNNYIFEMHNMPMASKEIFTFITVYGLGILKSLRMRQIELDEMAISRAHLIFNHLLKLNVDDRLNWTEIFPMCLKLQELGIKYNAYGYPLDLEYKFDKLKVFKLKVYHRIDPASVASVAAIPPVDNQYVSPVTQQYSAELKKFLGYHTNLTVLSINVQASFEFATIGQLKQLEELSLFIDPPRIENNYTNPDIQTLYDLKKLRKIHINDYATVIFRDFLTKLMSTETLKHLTIERCVMDQAFIDGLSRFQNLQYLKLNIQSIAENIANGVWLQLHQLHRITEMDLCGDFPNISKFLHSMTGNSVTLERLTIVRCAFDRLFVIGLAQLVNLRYLYMDISVTNNQLLNVGPVQFGIAFGIIHGHGQLHGHGQPPQNVAHAPNVQPNSIMPADWQQLQQLTLINEMVINTMSGCAKLFLQHLGCRATLEKFEIQRFYADTEILTAIKQFKNIKVLKLAHAIRFNRNHLLELLDDNRNDGQPPALSQIEEFHYHGQERIEDQHHMDFIFLGENYTYITNQFIVRLVKRWQTLQRVFWIGNMNNDINKAVKLNAKLYMELVEICRGNGRKLFVDIRPNAITVPAAMYTMEREWVQIGLNYDGNFNGN